MTEEIKEMLDKLNKYDDYKYRNNNGIRYKEIEAWEIELLLNYITNLQKENVNLKELCDKYEEEHNTAFKLWTMKMEEMPDYEEKIKYKSRNEKAIEYIEERKNLNWYADGVFVYELLNILNGGDE